METKCIQNSVMIKNSSKNHHPGEVVYATLHSLHVYICIHTCVRIQVFVYTKIPVKCRNVYKCKIPVNNRKKERGFCNRLLAWLQPFPLFNSLLSVFPFANCCWNTFKSNDKPVWFLLIYSQLGLVKLIM